MRIAIIGAQGQLGKALQKQLAGDLCPFGHDDIEITDPQSVSAALTRVAPEVVINAAAYNLVDRAEEEPEVAYAGNALGPRNLAIFCASTGMPLLHVSSDYVFSGSEAESANRDRTSPYSETDTPSPQSAYAVSKLAGEYFVRNIAPRSFVVRTCGLYGETRAQGKGNFVETMLRLSGERDELNVVDDQRCTPTSTADLAVAIAKLIETDAYGLYHATNSGSATWREFAEAIFRLAGRPTRVQPITTAEYGAKAPRPRYSVLDNKKLAAAIRWELPPWEEALAAYLNNRS